MLAPTKQFCQCYGWLYSYYHDHLQYQSQQPLTSSPLTLGHHLERHLRPPVDGSQPEAQGRSGLLPHFRDVHIGPTGFLVLMVHACYTKVSPAKSRYHHGRSPIILTSRIFATQRINNSCFLTPFNGLEIRSACTHRCPDDALDPKVSS